MTDADETAEHAVPIGIAGEDRDPPPSALVQAAALPVGTALGVEMRCDQPVVDLDIGRIVGRAEELVERLPGRQAAGRRDLQPVERDMRQAEIDRGDFSRIGRQIGQHVAAARRDGHDVAVSIELQRLEIDLGVFPDLRVDQAAEQPLEQAFEEAFAGQCSTPTRCADCKMPW